MKIAVHSEIEARKDWPLTLDAAGFYIRSIHPSEDPAIFAESVELVRDVTMEIDFGQNVILLNENLPDDPTALLTAAIEKATGRVIGLLTSTRSPDRIFVWFGSLAIRPDYRGHGLAKKLVQHAVDDRVRFDGYQLGYYAYVRVRRELNHASFHAFRAAGFFANLPVFKDRDALGPRAAHWDEATAKLLVITKNAEPLKTAEFDALGQETV